MSPLLIDSVLGVLAVGPEELPGRASSTPVLAGMSARRAGRRQPRARRGPLLGTVCRPTAGAWGENQCPRVSWWLRKAAHLPVTATRNACEGHLGPCLGTGPAAASWPLSYQKTYLFLSLQVGFLRQTYDRQTDTHTDKYDRQTDTLTHTPRMCSQTWSWRDL